MTELNRLKAEIEALRGINNCGTDYISRADVLRILATHAAETAPVAVEGMPERVWLDKDYPHKRNGEWTDWQFEGGTEYIRADLAPTGNTALVEALPNGVTVQMVMDSLCGMTKSDGLTPFQQINARYAYLLIKAAVSQPSAPQPTPEVEALREALTDLVSWFDGGPSIYGPWIIKSGAYGADDAVEAARAALARGSVAEKGDTQ